METSSLIISLDYWQPKVRVLVMMELETERLADSAVQSDADRICFDVKIGTSCALLSL